MIKRVFALVCSMIMVWSVPVFAGCAVMEEQGYTEKQLELQNRQNGTVTFWTKGEPYLLDYRCLPELYITIKEDTAGILKNGDVIYFETNRENDRYFCVDGHNIKTTGVSAEFIPSKEKDNHFAIRISRENTIEKGVIEINFSPYLNGIENTEKENLPTFSLWLDADKTKENNLFAGEQNILLNDCFMDVLSSEEAAKLLNEQKQQTLEKDFPKLTYSIGKNTMLWNEEQRNIEYPIYINEKGSAMIDLNHIINIIEALGGTISWNSQEQRYIAWIGNNTFFISLEGKYIQNMENKEMFENNLEQKEGTYYINLRNAFKLFGMENHIIWDNNTKTITINK